MHDDNDSFKARVTVKRSAKNFKKSDEALINIVY